VELGLGPVECRPRHTSRQCRTAVKTIEEKRKNLFIVISLVISAKYLLYSRFYVGVGLLWHCRSSVLASAYRPFPLKVRVTVSSRGQVSGRGQIF